MKFMAIVKYWASSCAMFFFCTCVHLLLVSGYFCNILPVRKKMLRWAKRLRHLSYVKISILDHYLFGIFNHPIGFAAFDFPLEIHTCPCSPCFSDDVICFGSWALAFLLYTLPFFCPKNLVPELARFNSKVLSATTFFYIYIEINSVFTFMKTSLDWRLWAT